MLAAPTLRALATGRHAGWPPPPPPPLPLPAANSPTPAAPRAPQEQPRTYKALLCERLGDPTAGLGSPQAPLRLAVLPALPLTQPGSVRVRVAAAALNFADALQLQARVALREC